MTWRDEYDRGECSLEQAATAQVHGVAPPVDPPEPSYACRAFAADGEAALGDGVRSLAQVMAGVALSRGEYDRLLAAGCDAELLTNLNVSSDLGTTRVTLSACGSRFELEGPDPRLLLGVRDAQFQLVDLVALASHDEDQWSLLHGVGDMLGAWHLEAAHSFCARQDCRAPQAPGGRSALRPAAQAGGGHFRLRLFATPWDWLRGGGRGICVLDWGGTALRELRLLDGKFVTLVVDAGGREKMRALLKHGGLPMVVEDRDSVGRVA